MRRAVVVLALAGAMSAFHAASADSQRVMRAADGTVVLAQHTGPHQYVQCEAITASVSLSPLDTEPGVLVVVWTRAGETEATKRHDVSAEIARILGRQSGFPAFEAGCMAIGDGIGIVLKDPDGDYAFDIIHIANDVRILTYEASPAFSIVPRDRGWPR